MYIDLKKKRFKLAILASHPIQYQVPFYRELAKYSEIDLTVLFCSDWGLQKYYDEGFDKEIKWDIPLLEGFKYNFLPNYSLRQNLSSFWGLINLTVINYLLKQKFNAVWIHGWNSCTNWIVILSALIFRIPILFRCETNLLPESNKLKNYFKQLILTQVFKKISCFLAIGKYNYEFYRAYGVPKEKIFLVPYAVDNNFFLSKADELLAQKKELRIKEGISIDIPVILFCGKLIPHKCPMDLLKAYAEISKEKKVALAFVGDGNLRNSLQSYCKENSLQNVYFLGFKNQTELPTFYAIADIFVLSSDYEPWGLVVNEAMCFKLPVIVSDQVGASGDLVKEGRNGFIYKSGDVQDLAEKLRALIFDPELQSRMGQASYEIIKKWSYEEGLDGINNCMKFIGK